jgi:hypothetical protein
MHEVINWAGIGFCVWVVVMLMGSGRVIDMVEKWVCEERRER